MTLKELDEQVSHLISLDLAHRKACSLEFRQCEVNIIDLRTLSPYDWDAIVESVKRTNRALVVHEESKAWGYGAEIASRIGEELFEWLDAPVRRVAALDAFVGYHPTLEDMTLPQVADIESAVISLAAY